MNNLTHQILSFPKQQQPSQHQFPPQQKTHKQQQTQQQQKISPQQQIFPKQQTIIKLLNEVTGLSVETTYESNI